MFGNPKISVKKRSTKKEVKKSVDPSNPLVPIGTQNLRPLFQSQSLQVRIKFHHQTKVHKILQWLLQISMTHMESDMPTNEQLGFISINDIDHPETYTMSDLISELGHELTDRRPEDITVKKISRPRRALTSLSAQDKSLTLESQTTIPLPSFNLTQILCSSFGGHTCESCLLVPDCYFCDSTDKCIPYAFLVQDLFSGAFCPGIRIYYKTCKANFAVIVFVSSLFGLTVLIILISLLIMVIIRKRRLSEIYKKVEYGLSYNIL
ncbi:hypothetical protein HZS_171 [Henneguya salminicola]|nr:hypothetical protein HZS_171 [Henneguya salminicola]